MDKFIPLGIRRAVKSPDRGAVQLTGEVSPGNWDKNPEADGMFVSLKTLNIGKVWIMRWDLGQDNFGLAKQLNLFAQFALRTDFKADECHIRIDKLPGVYTPDVWLTNMLDWLPNWTSKFGKPIIWMTAEVSNFFSSYPKAAVSWNSLKQYATIKAVETEVDVPMVLPTGKMTFTWQLQNCFGGNAQQFAEMCVNAGFTSVGLKIADGAVASLHKPRWFSRPLRSLLGLSNAALIPSFVTALKARGIRPIAWQYIYLNSPLAEAQMAVDLLAKYEIDCLLVDAEGECANKIGGAGSYIGYLRSHFSGAIGLCSYRYPDYHKELPWTQFLAGCDFHAPQVYWVAAHNAGAQLRSSVTELLKLKNLPVFPIGAAYPDGSWISTVADVNDFDATAHSLNLLGAGWWCWDDHGFSEHSDLLAAVSKHQWGPPKPIPTVSTADWAKEVDPYLRNIVPPYTGSKPS